MAIEKISSESIYTGRIFDVRIDRLCEDGLEYQREIITHHGSAVIVPIFADMTVALVRQYRHAAGKYLLEIPAGSLAEGEEPLHGAIRELEEEIGVKAANIERLSEFYVSPGFLTEKMHLFIATGLTETGRNLDEDEILSVERYRFSDALEMIANGGIEDAKTIIGVTLVAAKYDIH